ncbi:hypothetical protein COOONC_08220 [Cooperia oncophora]
MFLDMQIRICILYEFKLKRHVPIAFENLRRAFGEGAISRESVYRWYHRFREGKETLEDERGPFSIINDDELKKFVEENPTVSLRELAKHFGVGRTAIRYHLDKIANGKRVRYCAKRAAFARKWKQGILGEDDEEMASTSESTCALVEASAKQEAAAGPSTVRIAESQEDSKQEVPTLNQELVHRHHSIQTLYGVDDSTKSDDGRQEIRIDASEYADGSRETKECITYLF